MNPRRILSSRHYGLLTAAFALFVVYGSLVPLQYVPCSFSDALARYSTAMGKPLSFASRSDWAANVLLFIPLGFVGLATLTVDRVRPLYAFGLIPAMAVFSAAVEFLQIWFPARTTSINDVVAETLGGLIGMGLWALVGQSLTDRIRTAWASLEPGDWAAKLLPVYLSVLVFAHGMPFDLTISPGEIWHKYQRGLEPDAQVSDAPTIGLLPKTAVLPEKLLLHVVYFLPLGVLLARLPNPRWRDESALGRVFIAGLFVAGAIEFLQLIVASCGCYAADVLFGAMLVAAGWKLATRPTLSMNVRIGAGVVWCVAIVGVRWWPMNIPSDPQPFNLIPFADYYAGNYLTAFNRIFHVLVLFIPVGFLLPWPKPFRWLLAPLTGGALSTIIEMGQQQWTTHTATISDVILALFGVSFGAIVQARVGMSKPIPKQTVKPSAYPKIVFYTGMPSSAKQR